MKLPSPQAELECANETNKGNMDGLKTKLEWTKAVQLQLSSFSSVARHIFIIEEKGLLGINLSRHPQNENNTIISHISPDSIAAYHGLEVDDVIVPQEVRDFNHNSTLEWFRKHSEKRPLCFAVLRQLGENDAINNAMQKAFPNENCRSFEYSFHRFVIHDQSVSGNVGIAMEEKPSGKIKVSAV